MGLQFIPCFTTVITVFLGVCFVVFCMFFVFWLFVGGDTVCRFLVVILACGVL